MCRLTGWLRANVRIAPCTMVVFLSGLTSHDPPCAYHRQPYYLPTLVPERCGTTRGGSVLPIISRLWHGRVMKTAAGGARDVPYSVRGIGRDQRQVQLVVAR
ncbi:hypothetical protein K458DRAFT_55892 [Lentithecium fluviatile CBS 122367]|uniref:Secreted protein n=1 Tax=Lentithecium fluviatile CBS 122367 TaxID=1168545 RepID=A0A6G1IX33_9PLEO|nr:hypothetical protein K458DRAFT_55892 [Lentithecium fluviatile CBS 122367]